MEAGELGSLPWGSDVRLSSDGAVEWEWQRGEAALLVREQHV